MQCATQGNNNQYDVENRFASTPESQYKSMTCDTKCDFKKGSTKL